jgi:hypothetical protein
MPTIKDTILDFQYNYSKLFVWGFNRNKFEMESTQERLWAINNSKNTFIALLFTLIPSFFICSALIVPFTAKSEMPVFSAIVIGLVQSLFGFIAFRQFLWLVNGWQELIIEKGNLILWKKGVFWTNKKIYPLNQIKDIRQAFDEDQSSKVEKIQRNIIVCRKILLTHIVGEVLFDYQFNEIKVFSELDCDEKRLLIDEIIKRKNACQ